VRTGTDHPLRGGPCPSGGSSHSYSAHWGQTGQSLATRTRVNEKKNIDRTSRVKTSHFHNTSTTIYFINQKYIKTSSSAIEKCCCSLISDGKARLIQPNQSGKIWLNMMLNFNWLTQRSAQSTLHWYSRSTFHSLIAGGWLCYF
jgi:hypothetical protein